MWWITPIAAATTWPSLDTPPPPQGGGGADAALIIGIEDYLAAPDVPGAVANARAWHAWLTTTRGVPPEHVRLLRDGEASREAILEGAARVGREVGAAGTLWVVFVGHGAPAIDGTDGLLVGADARQTARSLQARSVSRGELIEALGSAAANTVVVLDACFSGQTAAGPLVEGLQPMVPVFASAPPRATVLSAGASDQLAGPLPGLRRPAFSYLVLGALHGWGDADADGAITAAEAVAYARRALEITLTDRDQRPALDGPAPTAPLSRGQAPGPDLAAIARQLPAQVGGSPAPSHREPEGQPAGAPSALEAMLSRTWRLRNTPSGEVELQSRASVLFAGVGGAGVVVGQTTMAQLRQGRAINLGSACFVEGRRLPRRKGERIWPCLELPERLWDRVHDLYTPWVMIHARGEGLPIDHLETPRTYGPGWSPGEPTRGLPTDRGITVGMPIAEALRRMPAPPDEVVGPSLRWFELGLQLLVHDDVVALIRIWPAGGAPP